MQTEGNWSYRFGASGYQVYDHQLSMPEAEKFCVSQGGHLPSVTSKEENSEIKKAVKKENTGCQYHCYSGQTDILSYKRNFLSISQSKFDMHKKKISLVL